MKQNDWIVANINNPNFSESDFKNIQGLSLDNTQLLPMSSYLDSKFITENDLFKNDDGTFNKDKFETFYKNQASKFSNFQEESSLDNYEYGFWDIYQKPDSRVKNPDFNLEVVNNPEHVSYGVVAPNELGERTKSDFELAEKQEIFDWKTQKFTNETPEDYTLFSNPVKFISNLFSDPLVLAKYEQDEIDPVTGEVHRAGSNKLNSKGEYYFETLGDRSIVGKEILSLGDIMTKEDSFINKYDFFDSDDLEKSTTGVITKNLASIAPLAVLGSTGAMVYSGFYIARELAKSLPMIHNIITMFSDSEDPKLLNQIAGIGQKFTGGTSEHAKSSTFSIENLGNLISDVVLQWGQQKTIANSISKVKGSSNAILDAAEAKAALEYEKRAKEIWNRANNGEQIAALQYTNATSFDDISNAVKTGAWRSSSVGAAAMQKVMPEAEKAFSKRAQFGQDLSLVYMALISNYDVYNDAIDHGATRTEAAALALGSLAGMFSVDKYAHLGEIFFDETPEKLAARSLMQGLRDEASELSRKIGTGQITRDLSEKGLVNLMKKAADKSANFIKNYESGLKNHTLGFFGKAFGEGLEETAEELNTDLWRSLYELAGQFGITSQTDIGAWDNAFDRYAMSFLGGTVGGGLFYGIDAIKNPRSTADRNTQKELLYLVSQGKTNQILDGLSEMHKKGQLASKDLSIDTTEDDKGNKVFITADENHQSQNDYVYKIMRDSILQMDSILNEHGLNLTEDKLFEKMVLSNQRYMALKNSLFDKSYITQYYDDYQQIVSDVFNIEKDIQNLKDSTSDEAKRKESSDYQNKLEELEKKRADLIERKDAFLRGDYNLDYVDKMLFYIHPEVNKYFYSSMFEQWVEEKYHKNVKELSQGELDKYGKEYQELKKSQGKEMLNTAFGMYKAVRGKIEEGLGEVSHDDVTSWGKLLDQLVKTSTDSTKLGYDDRIPTEKVNTDEVLNSLGVIKTSEYDKPWRSDPDKVNKAFQLQLEENSSAAFEVVKDFEDGYWSIHFKTPRTLTLDQKQRLFKAAATVIPEGDKLSTWGELTKGGISGINRFGQLDFLGGIEFEQVGTRKVYQRNVYSGLSADQLKEALEKQKSFIGDDKTLDRNLYYNIEQINLELEKLGETGFDLSGYERSDINSNNYVTEVEIPIWQKATTGETEEDYRDRYVQREGESDEDFRNRKISRANKIEKYNREHFIDRIQEFLNNNSIIDRSSYRKLIAELGIREQDLLNWIINKQEGKIYGISSASSIAEFNKILLESLKKLKADLSNKDEIIEEIIVKTRKLRRKEFDSKNKHRLLVFDIKDNTAKDVQMYDSIGELDTIYPDKISFDDFVDAINSSLWDSPIQLIRFEEEGDDSTSIYWEDFLQEYFYLTDNNNSVLFKDILQKAIQVHNLQVEQNVTGESREDEINAIKKSLNKSDYFKVTDNSGDYVDDGDTIFLSESGYQDAKTSEIKQLEKLQKKVLEDIVQNIGKNKDLNTLVELKKKVSLDLNPVVKVLKAVLPKLGEDFEDIETTLESIYNQFESLEVPTSFTLSNAQQAALNKALQYLDLVRAVVASAKTVSTYFAPLPYNKSINEFIRDNKDIIKDVKELLELDDDIANVIEESANHFNLEIRQWLTASQRGSVNKREMFSKFDENFTKAKLEFFKQIKDQCKINGVDLLKGFEHIDVDKPDALVEIEKLFYNNFKESKLTAADLVNLIERQTKSKEILKQTSGLSKSLSSEFVFTDYDKFIYFISLTASDPIDFYEFYKDYVANSKGKDGQKIAPLTFQEWNIRLGFIQKSNQKFVNEVLQEFANKYKIKIPILKNATFINGIAGAGKTDVVIRALQDKGSVWVSGPSETQIDNLKTIIPHAETFGHKELFAKILGESQYNEILQEIKDASNKKEEKRSNSYDGKYIHSQGGKEYATLKDDKISFVTKDAPKQLVIDEVTLFSNVELQILSKWAEKTGTHLLLAGDTHQNGNNSIGFNVDPELLFTFRTPEMKISLRDANIWKYNNQKNILEYIDELITYKKPDLLRLQLSNFNFSYYLKDDKFTGELVTKQLTSEHIKTLNGSIAFVGDINSDVYLKLKNSGKSVEVFKTVDQIQGKEFDYVVTDIDLSFRDDGKFTPEATLTIWLNNLYTIITRSKKGTILIDNGLTNSIGESNQEKYSNDNISITPEITKQYVDKKLEFLNSLNLTRKVPLEPTEEKLKEEEVVVESKEEVVPEKPKDEPDVEDHSYLDIEAVQETIIPVYGNMNLSGLIMNDKGKLVKGANRDLGIFLQDNQEIESKDRPLESLFQLKSIILFNKTDNEFWYNKLNAQITNLFSIEDLQNIKYYVSAEDYNPQTHRLLTKEAGYKEGEQVFSVKGSPKKLFTLIGVIEKDGKKYEITLGALSNPETLRKNSKDVIDPATSKVKTKGTITLINERAERTSDEELKRKLKEYARTYDDKVTYYENQLEKLVTKGRWRIKKPSFDRCTRIQKIKDKDGNIIYHPLNEYFDQNTSQYVVSPVYAQVDRNGEDTKFPYLQDDEKGKPVIFVSSFGLYNPTELMKHYIEQKKNPETNFPEVRKIILSPRGVMFEDLLDQDKIQGSVKDGELVFPFSNTAVAFRMYMSLWNFRAAITKFNEKVKEYLTTHNINSDEINQIALEEANAYDGSDNFREKATEEQKTRFKPLWDLNDWLTEQKVPRFRLGYNQKHGAYSRFIDKDTIGTYINYNLANDYEKAIKTLFTNVIDKIVPEPPSKEEITVLLGKDTPDFEYHNAIDTWVRKLGRGLEIDVELKSETDTKYTKFTVKDNIEAFKSLPLQLVQICRNMNFGQSLDGGISRLKELLEKDPTTLSWLFIKVKNSEEKTKEELDYLSIADQFTGGLRTTSYSGNPALIPGIVPYSEEGGAYDRRLINMFNLAFHGSISRNTAPATGTLLRHGIFADTFLLGEYDEDRAFRASSTNRSLYETNAMPSSPVLKIDISEWDGKEDPKVVVPEVESEIEVDKELDKVNQILGKTFSTLDQDKIKNAVQRNVENMFGASGDEEVVLNTIVEVEFVGDKSNFKCNFKTVRDIIQDYTLSSDIESFSALEENGSVEYSFKVNDQEYKLVLNDENSAEIIPVNVTKSVGDYVKDVKEIIKNVDLSELSAYVGDQLIEGLIGDDVEQKLDLKNYGGNLNSLITAIEENCVDGDLTFKNDFVSKYGDESFDEFKSELSKLQNDLNKDLNRTNNINCS